MKRRLKYIITAGVAMLLLLATLGTVAWAQPEVQGDPLHFGVPGMGSNKTMAASLLFKQLFGTSPTKSEAAYLDTLSGITFTYNDTIPDSVISTEYNGEAGTLVLSMNPYSFVAANGATVVWIPQKATLDTQAVPFSANESGGYSAVLSDLFHTDDFDVKISLSVKIDVPSKAVDALLTSAYGAAEDALKIIKAYESEYAVWYAANEKYLAYQAYLDAVKAFEQYEADLKYYNEVALPSYEEYLKVLEVQKLYDDWEHYKAYDEYLKNGVVKRQEYLTYLAKVEKVTAKLAILENLYATDSNGWMFYASLMGGTVDMVLQDQEKLEFAGVTKADIRSAGVSTARLKVLLTDYNTLRVAEYSSDHVRLTTLYNYYTEHYSELKEHLCNLYGKLQGFYNNGAVRQAIIFKGKLERYRQFTGILYVTRSCIDDSMTRDSGWFLQDGKSCPLHEIVEAANILPDTNSADPSSASMPSEEVARVDEVAPIDKPEKPQPQARPSISYMEEPKKPTVVTDPNADPSKIPPYAESAGKAPSAPEMEPELKALAEDLRAGKLPKREPIGVEKTLTLTTEMICPVSIKNEMTVTFYAYDGKTVLDRQKLEYGSQIIYRGPSPVREPDTQYVYSFAAWVLSDGSAPEKMVLTQNLSLYPYYHTSVRYYTVTWVLNSEIKTERRAYGDMPKCPFVTDRQENDYYTYRFSGWDREIEPVTCDVTYTATITQEPRLYEVTWVLGDQTVVQSLPYGAQPTPPENVSRVADDYQYEFLSWSPAPSAVTGDVVYEAVYKKTPLAVADNGAVQGIAHTEGAIIISASADVIDVRAAALYAQSAGKALQINWSDFSIGIKAEDLPILTNSFCRKICASILFEDLAEKIYDVKLSNSVGNAVEISLPITIVSLGDRGIYLREGDGWARRDGEIDYTGAFSVRICEVYGISVEPTENCYISELALFAEAGSVIDLRIGCTFGYRVSAARVTLANGTEIPVNDLSFVMPAEVVFVELTVTKAVYHVTFMYGDTVLSETDYFLGEDIVFPQAPEKESDDSYHYTFSGWSNDLTVAMGDEYALVFEALFIQTPRDFVDPFVSTEDNSWILITVLSVLGALILTGVGLLVFFKVRKKKEKCQPKEEIGKTQELDEE